MDISGALRNAGLLYNRAELERRERSDECSIPNSQFSSDGAPLLRMTIKNWELGNWSDAAMSRISEDASGLPEPTSGSLARFHIYVMPVSAIDAAYPLDLRKGKTTISVSA